MTSDAPWNPPGRVRKLLEERDALGRPLVFVESAAGQVVHVVGPDEDQPGYDSLAAWLLTRRYRTVCGTVIRKPPNGGYAGVFDDDRLCYRCLRAFNLVSLDAGAAIFADNSDDIQKGADLVVARIQRGKRDEARERASGEVQR